MVEVASACLVNQVAYEIKVEAFAFIFILYSRYFFKLFHTIAFYCAGVERESFLYLLGNQSDGTDLPSICSLLSHSIIA